MILYSGPRHTPDSKDRYHTAARISPVAHFVFEESPVKSRGLFNFFFIQAKKERSLKAETMDNREKRGCLLLQSVPNCHD
jgi:hypothetical protein